MGIILNLGDMLFSLWMSKSILRSDLSLYLLSKGELPKELRFFVYKPNPSLTLGVLDSRVFKLRQPLILDEDAYLCVLMQFPQLHDVL